MDYGDRLMLQIVENLQEIFASLPRAPAAPKDTPPAQPSPLPPEVERAWAGRAVVSGGLALGAKKPGKRNARKGNA
jgi:hypothetical protein